MFIVPIDLQAFLVFVPSPSLLGHIWGHIAKTNFGGLIPLTVLQIAALHPLNKSYRKAD
jgi:hypothetical protein